MRLTKPLTIILLILIGFGNGIPSFAYNNEGTSTYHDYLFVLVHGVHSQAGMWDGTLSDVKYRNIFGNLREYLEKDIENGGLGLKGKVFYYTFTDPDGSNLVDAKELADPSNPNNWFKRARDEFHANCPDKPVPSRFIVITHSMGNFAVRSYIYSDYLHNLGLLDKGFYQDDIAKVVFIAPPFLGSEVIFMSLVKYRLAWQRLVEAAAAYNFMRDFVNNMGKVAWGDPAFVYCLAKKYVAYRIYDDEVWGWLKEAVQGDLFGLGSTNIWEPAAIELMPVVGLGEDLRGAKLDDPTKEPSYSIVYGRGVPSPNVLGTGISLVELKGATSAVNYLKDTAATRGVADKIVGKAITEAGLFLDNDFALTLMPHSGFWDMPTEQGKFLSFLMAQKYLTMTNDGDLFVPTWSAKAEGVEHLKRANRHEHIFKSEGFENYLSGQFKLEIAAATAAYYASKYFGVPDMAAAFIYWSTAFSLIDKVEHYRPEIKDQGIYAHGSIVRQYDLIKTAILDTPAILTIQDLQRMSSGEGDSTSEEAVKAFTSGEPIPSGYESVTVKAIQENRAANGNANLPIPMTLDGQRMYATNITITKEPKRVAGKLNYLVPALMKKFEYSFNFSAWQPITGVNPETGEFVMEDLPFAEGQNILAIRSENAVGIKSHQILNIVLNTIPMLPSQFQPAPNSYTNNNQPAFKVKFAKSAYSSQPLENISISRAKLIKPDGEEIDITPYIRATTGGETYDRNITVEYTPLEPLPDGEYKILIIANSNVGISQALWTVNIDTRAPSIAMESLKPFSPNSSSSLTIRYTATDPSAALGTSESASMLKSIRCDLYDQTGNYITQISTDESIASGEHYFNWDGAGERVADGTYTVKIKAFDLAGNFTIAETPLVIDSTPPQVLSANVTPNPMSSKFNEQKLETTISEKSQVFIKMINQSTKSAKVYLTSATGAPADGRTGKFGSYTWSYNNAFMPGPEDGIYDIELTAQDEAGNESTPYKLIGIRIDRTPPVVYAQATLPYVLSNSGSDPYTTTLSYQLSESNDTPSSKGQGSRVKIKLYNETTHDLAGIWESAPDSLTDINHISWNGNSPDYPKGSYRFQIIAEDDLGNQSTAYASCVKDGIAPVISFPSENGMEISGTVAIRGTAIDPDWTNSKPFKQYRVFYKEGQVAWVKGQEDTWKADAIEVPLSNRGTGSPANGYTGLRPLQNDSTLAYLYTNGLVNGTYTVLVVVDEEGGESIATTRVVEVQNDPLAASIPSPYVELSPVPSEISFKMDNSVKLPIRFLNSVKPANVHVEVLRSSGPVVMYKYFPNLAGAPYIGQPSYRAGSDLGYFIWEDESSWHVRWSSDGSSHRFSGNLIAMGGSIQVTSHTSPVTSMGNMVNWDSSISNSEQGFDFTITDGKQLMITPKMDEDLTSPSPYASNVYLGISKTTQEFIPIMIDLENQRMLDLASMAGGGGGRSSGPEVLRSSVNGIDWDGKLDTGAFTDNGTYIIRIRAEGVDGFGVATDEARVRISAPFEINNLEITNKNFSPVSAPDRVSVFYNLSKDSLISAYVYDENNNLKCTLKEGGQVLGALNPNNKYSVSWRGNYPAPDSGTVVTSGKYYIRLIARAVDGSGEKIEEVRDISIIPLYRNTSFANLELIGNEASLNGERIRLAEGESPYYFEAKASGLYYPPKDFNYTVSASGKQRFTTYPYVPFAALVHRGFRQVDVKVVARFLAHGYVKTLETRTVFDPLPRQEFWWEKRGGRDKQKNAEGIFHIRDSSPKTLTESFSASDIWRNWNEDYPGYDDALFKLEIYSGNGEFLLDQVQDWKPTSSGYILTDKGMFEVRFNYSKRYGDFYLDCNLDLRMPEASPIEYSRLTNRFIPWVDFVCAKQSVSQKDNFGGYMNSLDKLGFPGNSYFNGSDKKVEVADAPHRGSFDSSLFSANSSSLISTNTNGTQAPKTGEIYSKASTGFSEGSASDYTAYLSDGYLEFIPITKPEGGYFQLGDGAKVENATVRYNGYKDPSTLNLKAVTPVKMVQAPNAGESQTPFIFPWPDSNASVEGCQKVSDFESKYGVGGENYKNLIKSAGGDPQNWSGYGTIGENENICFYELDQGEITTHRALKSSHSSSGRVVYYKDRGKSEFRTSLSSVWGNMTPLNCIEELKFGISGLSNGVQPGLTSDNSNAEIYAYDTCNPIPWTSSSDDATLYSSSGLIRSGFKLFNSEDFRGTRKLTVFSDAPYNISDDVSSSSAQKYTFIKNDPTGRILGLKVDNPNLVLQDWDIFIKDRNRQDNADLELGEVKVNGDHTTDCFDLKLKTSAAERRYVEIKGNCAGPFELMYFDGESWKTIATSIIPKSGTLAWWNVNRLNGKYTVLLRTGSYIATQDIYVGTLVKDDSREKDVFSAYRRAQLKFKPRAFGLDQIATITPVNMTEIMVRNRPIIMTHGPIVEIKPSPTKFKTPQEDGIDLRPTLKFYYTLEDLKNLGLNPDPADPTKNLGMNIHQITSAGDLQVISDNHQDYDPNNQLYCFWGAVDHFSNYTLTKGKIKLSAPIVLADRYVTNKDTVVIYGTAEVGSRLELKVLSSPLHENGEGEPRSSGASIGVGEVGTAGRFRFENVSLLQEGENYIYVLSSPKDNPDVKTQGEIIIIKDTVPPVASAYANLKAFSPNNDNKWDTVEYDMSSNEKGKLGFIITDPDSRMLINQELETEAGKFIKLVWGQYGFNIYQRNESGEWMFKDTINASSVFADGYYNYTVYAIDEAGNISNNLSGTTVIDTVPPKILTLSASPNPFTPNDDGIKDTASISYSLSEPTYVTTKINREDGVLFIKHSQTVGDFSYPALGTGGMNREEKGVGGSWSWDGKGSRNEMLGGTYFYYIEAEDPVGNFASSEVKSVVVDRAPSLIPYAYAEPDPFSPVNPRNNFTEIKYYLSRDNLQVQASIIGREGRPIKNLVFGETQNKGEHSARWYGDFVPGTDVPRASVDPSRVGDGSYEFKVIAVDPEGGRPAEVTSTVLVDNVAPHIMLQPVRVDYVNKKATLAYSIPETSSVEVSVYDIDGNLIDILDSGIKEPGSHDLVYSVQRTEDRQKYFKVIATDSARNEDGKTTEIFSFSPMEDLQLLNTAAAPDKFSPNGDGLKDLTRISYQISGGAPGYKVDIQILNSSGATIRRLAEDEPQNPGTFSFYWNGQIDSADPTVVTYASDGIYAYRIAAEDKLGTRVESTGNITLVSTKPTVNVLVDPTHISPNNDGTADTALITYGIDYPVAWIDSPAQIKLDILNSNGEAVFTKTFSQTAGTYSYTWNVRDGGDFGPRISDIPAGTYYVYANATDALGTHALPKSAVLYVDYTQPEPSNFTITPQYAKLGAKVLINLNFDEILAENPDVKVLPLNRIEGASAPLESASGNSYVYSYTIGADDPEGLATISVEARDLSLIPIIRTKTFIIDKTNPVISNVNFSPNPAKAGNAYIDFKVNEDLSALGVKVTQNGADPIDAVVSNLGSGNYRATHNVFSGYDGPVQITIEVIDLAGNINSFTPSEVEGLIVDTIPPTFSGISCEVNNPDFSKYAKDGSEVAINFKASEQLKFNPEVKVNGHLASYSSGQSTAESGQEYVYKYTVNASEIKPEENNQLAEISISGYDPANNLGENVTSDGAESFRIDLTNPTVIIATSSNLIANPRAFSTNANPDGTDIPRLTTLYYKLAEPSYVTVKVYKVHDDQITYSAADFNSGSYIQTLLSGDWKDEGVQLEVRWNGRIADTADRPRYDANSDGYADPGKYAFIVEGWDRAGNLTLKKWGGTVWIQDNVLTLRDTDQRNASNNPDPRIISPNGNSTADAQKRARLYFYIDLSVNPAVVRAPERIEAQAIEAETKKVGKYSVKVYSDAGLTNLVRTITSEADAWAATNTWEDWDGRNDAGILVSEGIYYMVVDVKDYAGNPANQNLLTRQVIVDNTAPDLSNITLSNQYLSPNSAQSTAIKDITVNYQLADNLSLLTSETNILDVKVEILKGATLIKELFNEPTREVTASPSAQDQLNWRGDLPGGLNYVGSANGGGIYPDGEYTCRITAVDRAGNAVSEIRNFQVDTTKPHGSIVINKADRTISEYTNSENVKLALNYSDDFGSGAEKMRFSYDGTSWTDWENIIMEKDYTLSPAGEGLKKVWVNYLDRAGNYSDFEISDTITIDKTLPIISSANNPSAISTRNSTTRILVTLADTISSILRWDLVINNASGTSVYSCSGLNSGNVDVSWNGAGLVDGYYYYYIVVTDGAGNIMRSYENGYGPEKPYGGDNTYYRVLIDRTPPEAVISYPSNNGWVRSAFDVNGTAHDTYPGNYKVEYHNGTEWVKLSESVYPEEARITGNTASLPVTLECEAKISSEAASQYIGNVSVEGSASGQYPSINPPAYEEFEVREAGNYIFETYGEGAGYGSYPFGWISRHYLQNNFGGDIISPIQELGREQSIYLDPGTYRVAILMQIGFGTSGTKKAGSRIKPTVIPDREWTDEKQFTIDKRQKIQFSAYCSGVGTYYSWHYLLDGSGSTIAYTYRPTYGYISTPILEPGTYRIRTIGRTSGDGSQVQAYTEIHTNYGEWTTTKTFNVQYGQEMAIESALSLTGAGGSEHWLFDSGGSQLFYANSTSRAETRTLSAGTYTLRVKGWTSFGSNTSYTRASPKRNDIQGGKLANWNTSGLNDIDYLLRLAVSDEAGNPNENSIENQIIVKVDNTPPSITPPAGYSFNPYLTAIPIAEFVVTDPKRTSDSHNSGIGSVTAQIEKISGARVKILTVNTLGYDRYSISWDGTNDPRDYVNEGDYKLRISATDNAGNSKTLDSAEMPTVTIADNQYIAEGTDPYMVIEGSSLSLKWINGFDDPDAVTIPQAYARRDNSASYGVDEYGRSDNFTIDHSHDVNFSLFSDGGYYGSPNCHFEIRRTSDDARVGEGWHLNGGIDTTVTYNLSPGQYYLWVKVQVGSYSSAQIRMRAYYKDRIFNQYTKSCGPEYEDNIEGAATSDLVKVDNYIIGPTEVTAGGIAHRVWASDGNIFYSRNSSSGVKIAAGVDFGLTSPAIAADSGGNAYVAWVKPAGLSSYIYFQKVPYRFAPINGTVSNLMVNVPEVVQTTTQQSTLEAPTLLEPADGVELRTTHPTFKWKAPKDVYSEYSVRWSQLPNAEGDGKATKVNTSGSEQPTELGTLYFAHGLDKVFDPALERNKTYYWKVVGKKVDGTEITSASINSFTCNPPFEISGITNYPNPFNPNKERTKLRYKLSKDADEVIIRIYDITGALVNELTGTPYGEGANIWSKYNDIEWDGRNGRGDMVLNGIYPFEVVAKLNGASVSGRGKIAVLK